MYIYFLSYVCNVKFVQNRTISEGKIKMANIHAIEINNRKLYGKHAQNVCGGVK